MQSMKVSSRMNRLPPETVILFVDISETSQRESLKDPPSLIGLRTSNFIAFLIAGSMWNLATYTVFLLLNTVRSLDDEEQAYIVYMGAKGEIEPHLLVASHHDILSDVLGGKEKASASIIYSYKHGFSGFSARLTEKDADTIRKMPNVVSVFPSKTYEIHTTRSWNFLGVAPPSQRERKPSTDQIAGSYDVIVGVIDTGLWPESKSFDDTGFEPVPSRWKGLCNNTGITNSSELFTCTRKIIGGRAYPLSSTQSLSKRKQKHSLLEFATTEPKNVQEFNSSRDANGHGSHTSSTATGALVEGANLFGLAKGSARGGYSRARVAMYKACWFAGFCSTDAILAAFDDAVHDGVDVLSVSLGGFPDQYDLDPIAIGSFHAVAKGIVVSCSAGNSGPNPQSLSNSAPWITTVGASSIDRKLVASVVLGNNVTIQGTGLNVLDGGKTSSLIFAGDIPLNGSSKFYASRCVDGYFDAAKIKGKILYCILDPALGLNELALAGAVGYIFSSDFYSELLSSFSVQATIIKDAAGEQIVSYIRSTKNPTASILKTTTLMNVSPAPTVTGFSSRGPNTVTPDIIKPDVIAPGLNILAAWSESSPIFNRNNVSYFSSFNIESGTSMSCPHVAGASALLKSVHPDWSPAAIKSALMTTATTLDNTMKPIGDFNKSTTTPFDTGSGQINPDQALDPGLIYDIGPEDYLLYLCESGFNTTQLRLISGDAKFSCSPPGKNSSTGPPFLNYPSFGFVGLTTAAAQSARRIVTNVGAAKSVYRAEIDAPASLGIAVEPPTLAFDSAGQKLSYTITVTAKENLPKSSWVFGSISWVESSHNVRSPIAVTSATKI